MSKKPSPINTMLDYKQEIDETLKSLQALSDEHFTINFNDINWDDAGYAEHLAKLVTGARNFVFQETIYLHKGERHETII